MNRPIYPFQREVGREKKISTGQKCDFFFLRSNNNIKHFFLHTFSTWCSNPLWNPKYKFLYIFLNKNSTPKAEKKCTKTLTFYFLQWQEQIYRPTIEIVLQHFQGKEKGFFFSACFVKCPGILIYYKYCSTFTVIKKF